MGSGTPLVPTTGISVQTARVYQVLWAASALFIVYATTIPFAFVSDSAAVHEHLARAIQQATLAQVRSLSRSDVLQNVFFFVPFGLLGCAALGRLRALLGFAITVVAAAALSIACELVQLLTADRISSVWDVAANSAGAFVGGLGYLIARESGRQIVRRFGREALTNATTYPLICVVLLVVIGAWEPFDFTLDVGTVWSKAKALMDEARGHWPPISDEVLAALRHALLTGVCADWLRRRRYAARPRLSAALACGFLAAALETSQFFISSRAPSIEDLAAALCGVVIGAAAYPNLVGSRQLPALLIVASFCAAVPFYLQPFVFSSVYAPVPALLFFSYYERTSLQTISHVVDLMLIYAPIGFCLQWSRRSSALVWSAVIAAVMASTLEYAQGWIVGRYPDLTDVGIGVLGGVLGAAVARRGLPASVSEVAAQP